jgi:trans-aconitate 2-methyltransferase
MRVDWDAATYDRVSDPALRWGREVVRRLELLGDETILDAGCGTGRVTEVLLDRVPDGLVVGLDASPAMLREARGRLAPFRARLCLVQADLRRPLPLTEVDAVFSTATFHWLTDHDALFRHLSAVLRPGGQLVAQCGGAGNLAAVRAAVQSLGVAPASKHYPSIDETSARLASAGFTDIDVRIHASPTPLEPGGELEMYLATIPLRMELSTIAPEERAEFVRAVARQLSPPEIDYVRLDIDARRAIDPAAERRRSL